MGKRIKIRQPLKVILNHRDTENTERNSYFPSFSVKAVPLWFVLIFCEPQESFDAFAVIIGGFHEVRWYNPELLLIRHFLMTAGTHTMTLPLQGIRILDLTRLLPGGVATMMLTDMGAAVVKIEDPNGGDYSRWMPPQVDGLGAYFRAINWGKRSLILDLKQPDGVAVLKKLVETADVLVEGFRPDVMTRLGCDYAVLKTVNPRLVYCAISGWGATGPYASRGGHDLNYTAVAGLTGAMRTPQPLGGQVADIAGAYLAFAGICAALVGRAQTGEGAFVDASLFDAAVPFAGVAWIDAELNGTGAGEGGLTGGAACYNIYYTRDHKAVSLSALEPKFWANFCAAVDRPDLLPDYLEPARQDYLRAEIEQIFALKTLAEWLPLLENADCCFAPVLPPEQMAANPHTQARGLFGIGAGGAPWLRSPVRFGDLNFQPGAVPGYGEHSRAILSEAGYSATQIESLAEAGVIKLLE